MAIRDCQLDNPVFTWKEENETNMAHCGHAALFSTTETTASGARRPSIRQTSLENRENCVFLVCSPVAGELLKNQASFDTGSVKTRLRSRAEQSKWNARH